MNAARPLPARRRGACPALSAPMQTGDGLLVRLVPDSAALSPAALAGLAGAARACGNGILEVTARGSLQLRGLSEGSMGALHAAVDALGITAREGLALSLSPLSGLDVTERMDGRALADAVRAGVAAEGLGSRLGPKVSVVIDGGGRISLDALKADVRLAARPDGAWDVALAGDAARATPDGLASPEAAAERVLAYLRRLAGQGPLARMADLIAPRAPGAPMSGPARPVPVPGEAIALSDGTFALPLALPFGAAESAAMAGLADAAARHGVRDLRPAPPRLLLATGLMPGTLAAFRHAVESLGFILDAGDPRLAVAACPGAPLCASGLVPARELAPQVAAALAPLLDGSVTVHLSGCAKGCAHPAPAALTLVGVEGALGEGGMDSPVALVRHGMASSLPEQLIPLSRLPAALARMARGMRPGERGADLLSRLDPGALLEPND
ncbi:MAG: precorrin-3B synthase [Rhizobiales bacterium]|nr:precorrin-3B synthase [Hyphomicrobiales bacterium]